MRQQEIKAKEKHVAWIRELEFREKEDQEKQIKMARVREAQRREAEAQIDGPIPKVRAVKEKMPSTLKSDKGKDLGQEMSGHGIVETVKEKLPIREGIDTEKG